MERVVNLSDVIQVTITPTNDCIIIKDMRKNDYVILVDDKEWKELHKLLEEELNKSDNFKTSSTT